MAVEKDLAACVGMMITCDNLDQGRLAGAVVPQQADYLVASHREIDVVQRGDVTERLRYLGHAEQRLFVHTKYLVRIADCGLRIADCGLRIANYSLTAYCCRPLSIGRRSKQ